MKPLVFTYKGNAPELYYKRYLEEKGKVGALLNFVELVACGKRSDGTYNHCREALEVKAKKLIEELK
jgi:hypothetical protein